MYAEENINFDWAVLFSFYHLTVVLYRCNRAPREEALYLSSPYENMNEGHRSQFIYLGHCPRT